jgi:hypothetical protein
MSDVIDKPFGNTVCCDDIRHEVDGKITLVGVYQDLMILTEVPAVIPKIGFYVIFYEPRDLAIVRDFPIPVSVFCPQDIDQPTLRGELGAMSPEMRSAVSRMPPPADIQGTPLVRLYLAIMASPLVLPTTGMIRFRANYNGETIRLGTMKVLLKSEFDKLAAEQEGAFAEQTS